MFKRFKEIEGFQKIPYFGNCYRVRIDGIVIDNFDNKILPSLDSLGGYVIKHANETLQFQNTLSTL